MKHEEAEKLARELRPFDFEVDYGRHPPTSARKVRAICDHILSGELRREIENAAYERVAEWIRIEADLETDLAIEVADALRAALIQPPAQKGARNEPMVET